MTSLVVASDTDSTESTGLMQSGNLIMDKLSKEGIVSLLETYPLTLPDDVFDEEPSCSAPYSTGIVKADALQAALERLNALRYLAGVPTVSLDQSLCDNAQYGAVILGAIGGLNHHPSKPDDMDSSFYQKAYEATSSSNLYAGRTLTTAVDGFMDDSDAKNLDRLGHRRWQLNPTMSRVGFGFAESDTLYRTYVTEKVFDRSGAGCDYNFISWPASGNFPNNMPGFRKSTAWSITLNPLKYQIPTQDSITVTLTRESDKKVWTFSGSDYSVDTTGPYFNIDTGSYGVANCIIFRPDEIETYDGIYTVHIDGLRTKIGTAVKDFTYQVDFFNTETYTTTPDTPDPTDPVQDCTRNDSCPAAIFLDVNLRDWTHDGIHYCVENGLMNGTSDVSFSPDGETTRAMLVTVLYRMSEEPAVGKSDFTDVPAGQWYSDAVAWAAENHIVTGYGNGTFGPEDGLTREQFATILYRYAEYNDYYFSMGDTNMLKYQDYSTISYWARAAVQWACGAGLINGVGDSRLAPQGKATRAQMAAILYRFCEKIAS